MIVDAPPKGAPPSPAPPGAHPNEEPGGTGFWLAAGRDGELRLAELGDELIVAGSAALAHATADGTLERLPDTLRGLVDPGGMYGSIWDLETLGGSWPDPVWMYMHYATGRSGPQPYLYYRKGERWQRKATKTGPLEWYYHAFAQWTDERVLALRLVTPAWGDESGDEPPSPLRLKRVAAAIAANPPRIDVLAPGAAPTPAPMLLAPGSRPLGLATLATGELFVLSLVDREPAKDIVAVQRFAPGASEGTLELLTEIDGGRSDSLTVVARGGAVYLAGHIQGGRGGLVLRWDGQLWQPAPPLPRPVLSLAVDQADTMWAITTSRDEDDDDDDDDDAPSGPRTLLWKRAVEGPWSAVRLPQVRRPDRAEPRWVLDPGPEDWRLLPSDPEVAQKLETIHPRQLLARADGELWLVANLDEKPTPSGYTVTRHVALRSRPVKNVLELPDPDSLYAEMLAAQPPKPWSDRCLEGWVQVATLAANEPAEAAVKLADDLVATIPAELQREFAAVREVEIRGRRVVGLLAHPSEPAKEQAILAALAKFGPEKRRFECFNPRPIRELKTF